MSRFPYIHQMVLHLRRVICYSLLPRLRLRRHFAYSLVEEYLRFRDIISADYVFVMFS